MTKAFIRLLTIGLISVAIIAIVLFFLRWLGSSQQYSPLNHPIAQMPYLLITDGGTTTGYPAQSAEAMKVIVKQCASCVLKVDARRSSDGKWYVFPQDDLSVSTNGSGYFSLQTSQQIEQLFFYSNPQVPQQKILTLSEAVEMFPNQVFMVVVHTRDASQLKEILNSLKSRQKKQSIILHSPFRQILTDARKEEPQWIFGISPSLMNRLKMMESIYIETMADIWSDLMISPPKVYGSNIFTPRLVEEFNKRFKPIVVETDKTLDQLPVELQQEIKGAVTPQYMDALDFFNSRNLQ